MKYSEVFVRDLVQLNFVSGPKRVRAKFSIVQDTMRKNQISLLSFFLTTCSNFNMFRPVARNVCYILRLDNKCFESKF